MSTPSQHERAPGRLRVLLVGNYQPDRQYSMRRYFLELAEGLHALGVEVSCIEPQSVLGKFVPETTALAKWIGYLDKYVVFRLSVLASRSRYDIVHIIDHSNAIYVPWLGRRKVVVTCHDLIAVRSAMGVVAENSVRLTGRILQRAILNGLRATPSMICVSEATGQEAMELIAPPRMSVIPNALRDDLGRMVRSTADALLEKAGYGGTSPFFLHVGGNQFYKNRPGVVQVFDLLADRPDFGGHKLILAGKAPDAALREAIAGARHADRIAVLEDPDDATVQALYSRAAALLFLSLTEGFGWPILEAQACGCLVVTTDRSPMRDVAGAGAILVDPDDPAAAARIIEAGMKQAPSLLAEAQRNVGLYRPERIYPLYLDFYNQVLASLSAR